MDSISILDLLNLWLHSLQEEDRSPQTVKRYSGAIRRFLVWYESQEHQPLTLANLTPIGLVGYRRYLQQQASASTVNIHVSALRVWCSWLSAQGYLVSNPASRLKLVGRQPRPAPRALKDSEVNALLRAAAQSRHAARDYAIVQIMLQTGMRIGECQALAWEDIIFGEKRGSVLIRAGKGNKSREVPLNGSARAALAGYCAPLLGVEASLRAVATAWPRRKVQDVGTPLWRSQKGNTLSAPAMWSAITSLVQACAVRKLVPEDMTPHTLRHTFARRYLDEHPGDLVGLAQLLGHTDLNTTRIYTQYTSEEIAERVDRLPLNAYEDLAERPSVTRKNSKTSSFPR